MEPIHIWGMIFGIIMTLFLLTTSLFMGGLVYMLWKIMGALRWMELSEAHMAHPMYNSSGAVVPPRPTTLTKQEMEGTFIPSSDFNAYVREEASNVAMASGMSDSDAVELIMEKIRQQNKGNVAEV